MLGSQWLCLFKKEIIEVSKPYRYARKKLGEKAGREYYLLFQNLIGMLGRFLRKFLTFHLCWFQNLIGMLGRSFEGQIMGKVGPCFKTLQVCQEAEALGLSLSQTAVFQNLIGMLGRYNVAFDPAKCVLFQNLIGMLGRNTIGNMLEQVMTVSKPYRYARKQGRDRQKKSRGSCFKTLQVCQEASSVTSLVILLVGFKTLQVCQEEYKTDSVGIFLKAFQNLIGMLGSIINFTVFIFPVQFQNLIGMLGS